MPKVFYFRSANIRIYIYKIVLNQIIALENLLQLDLVLQTRKNNALRQLFFIHQSGDYDSFKKHVFYRISDTISKFLTPKFS